MIPNTLPNSLRFPMLELFRAWRTYDYSRGHKSVDTNTYLALLEAIGNNVMVWSRDDLFTLCKMLLLKPHHDPQQDAEAQLKFTELFDVCIQSIVPTEMESRKPVTSDENKSQPTIPKPENKTTDAPQVDQPPTNSIGQSQSTVEEQKSNSGSKITHVAFRHDTGAVEGLSGAKDSFGSTWEADAKQAHFRLQGKYLPVEGRAVQQAMRSLRQLTPKREQSVTDLPATIRRVARRGYFDRVVTRKSLVARIPMVLLLDRRGSMVAFHDIVDQWADAARQQDPPIPVYYFQNCPANSVFSDSRMETRVDLEDWKIKHTDAVVLILSDAGAARGLYSDERILRTQGFLRNLRPRRIAWLNPMPRERWWGSTAAFIARRVPMFALDSLEFSNAFRFLKGKLLAR